MALTDATRLADFSSGVGTDGTLDTNNLNVSGVATAATLGVSGVSTAASSVIAGIITANSTGIDAGAGIITATSFVGSGADLTGVISGVELEFGGNSVGTAVTNINFVGFSSVTAPVSGLATVTTSKTLTIGVRVGSAVTFGITGNTFNVSNRAGGNTAISV